jgi:hypothetical protein
MEATPRKYKIERYIFDWHWSERSHAFAFETGAFLFGYMDYLKESGLSEATIRKHDSNVWNIGILTCQYGYYDAFSPDIFAFPPFFEIEFKRKMSDTPNALRSYRSTCNKLAKYVRDKGWKTLPEYDFDMTDNLKDMYIGLKLLETGSWRGDKKGTISFQDWIAILQHNHVLELHEVNSREEFTERLRRCHDALQGIAAQLESLPASDHYFKTKIRRS